MLLGAPAGRESASKLQARVWISAHDGDKDVKGLATGFLRTKKWAANDLARQLAEDAVEDRDKGDTPKRIGTEVLALGIGEEVTLDCDGICNMNNCEKQA